MWAVWIPILIEVSMERVAEGVYRLGSEWVNFYLVEQSGALTLVDTGLPGYRDQMGSALKELGRKASDVKAIVLTHTHSDHIGGAAALAEETGAPVLVHSGEAGVATGEAKPVNPKGFASSLGRPHLWAFIAHAIANKGMARITVPKVTRYADDEMLDVPGKLRVVYTPGHSSAHSGLLLEDRGVLFCGDALATLAVNTGERGPMVHPFNEDRNLAIRSFDVLEKIDAGMLLPGHGEPWQGRISDAVSEARRRL